MLAPGYLIGGRYRLIRLLGEGGMGVVWSAVNEGFGREVAIKVMLPTVAANDPTAIERFFTEARICGSIRHPGIVDVLDVGRAENGSPFLVMELLDGDSLDKVLHHAGTLKPVDVLPVIRDVARTLALAHDKGVIHRDLKPGNVYLHRLPDGQVIAKVLDFGVSKVKGGGAAATVTRTGMVVGSPAYMSPEQAGGRVELDPRSDVYALGVILYETLAGRLPYLEENYNALMIDIAVRDPPSLGSVAPGLPRPVLDLVKAAMMHDRDERLPTANALADRIEATLLAIGATASHAPPDPATIPAGPPPSSRVTMTARTSSALATNAGIRARRAASPWLLFGAAVVVVTAAGAWIGTKIAAHRNAAREAAEQASAAAAPPPPDEAASAEVAVPVPPVSSATAPPVNDETRTGASAEPSNDGAASGPKPRAPAEPSTSAPVSASAHPPGTKGRPGPVKKTTTKDPKDPTFGF